MGRPEGWENEVKQSLKSSEWEALYRDSSGIQKLKNVDSILSSALSMLLFLQNLPDVREKTAYFVVCLKNS